MENIAIFSNPAVKLGRWWFRNRSLSPVPFFLLMVALTPNFRPEPTLLVGILLFIFGFEALRIWAVGYAGSVTRTRGDAVGSFVHAGPYRWVRNPLYIANVGIYCFCGLAFGFTYLTLALFAYSCVQYTLIVRYEEQILATTFGATYQLYRQAVPRWLAFSRMAYPASGHHFNMKPALRSERTTLYLIAGLLLLVAAKRYFS